MLSYVEFSLGAKRTQQRTGIAAILQREKNGQTLDCFLRCLYGAFRPKTYIGKSNRKKIGVPQICIPRGVSGLPGKDIFLSS